MVSFNRVSASVAFVAVLVGLVLLKGYDYTRVLDAPAADPRAVRSVDSGQEVDRDGDFRQARKRSVTAIRAARNDVSLLKGKYPYVGSRHSVGSFPMVDYYGKVDESVAKAAGLLPEEVKISQGLHDGYRHKMNILTLGNLRPVADDGVGSAVSTYIIEPFEESALSVFDEFIAGLNMKLGVEKQEALMSHYYFGLAYSGMGRNRTKLVVAERSNPAVAENVIIPEHLKYQVKFEFSDPDTGKLIGSGSTDKEAFNLEFGNILE